MNHPGSVKLALSQLMHVRVGFLGVIEQRLGKHSVDLCSAFTTLKN